MELDIKTNITTDLVVFNNYDFVKNQVNNFVEKYKNMVVSEGCLSTATKDRATLNKIAKTMNDKRIEIEKKFKEQFEPFKNQVNSLIDPIKIASENIDIQIKKFEEIEKNKKYEAIKNYFNEIIGELKDLIPFELFYFDKWLLKSYDLDNIKELMMSKQDKIIKDLKVISDIKSDKETVLKDYYINNNFDLSATLQEKTRLEEREKQLKELEEKKKLEELARKKELEEREKQLKDVKQQDLNIEQNIDKLADEFNKRSLQEKYNINQECINEEPVNIQEPKPLKQWTIKIIATVEDLTNLKQFLINNKLNYETVKI